jgi:hypothetical protein
MSSGIGDERSVHSGIHVRRDPNKALYVMQNNKNIKVAH